MTGAGGNKLKMMVLGLICIYKVRSKGFTVTAVEAYRVVDVEDSKLFRQSVHT
jgi:hypothetical protein